MARSTRDGGRDGERGQILVLFTLAVVLLMVLAAIVIDVSLLRNDAGRMQNALDSGALAAGHSLPANHSNASLISNTARDYARTNYRGMPSADVPDPTTTYACLIGIDTATGLPRVADMPAVCNVSFPANSPQWRCTTAVCWAPCDPVRIVTDVCNTIILKNNVTQPYAFGRAVGVDSGNTGVLTSAACSGVCGSLPQGPVDAVLLLDRTGSMDDSGSVGSLRAGARSVLSAFKPDLQRIALGFTGPTSGTTMSSDTSGLRGSSQPEAPCAGPPSVHGIALDPTATRSAAVPVLMSSSNAANVTGGAGTLVLPKPAGTVSGNLEIALLTVDGGNGSNVNPPSGWTPIQRTNNGGNVTVFSYYRVAGNAEGASYTWNFNPNRRAAGAILRYAGFDPADPIDAFSSTQNSTGNGFNVTPNSITTGVDKAALIGLYGTDTRATWTAPGTLTEQVDTTNVNAGGPAILVATGSKANAGSTAPASTMTATASASAQWAAQLLSIRPTQVAIDAYGTDPAADMSQWITVGFTGLDSGTPAITYREAYNDGAGNVLNGTHILQDIKCFDVSRVGTNLATPLNMAVAYLQTHGRTSTPLVKQGIILETDGTPEHNPGQQGVGDWNNFTCAATTAAANAAKAAGIELYMIGYGVTAADNGGTVPKCPDNNGRSVITQLASMATNSSSTSTTKCDANENTDGDHFFCTPAGGDLAGVLHAAAAELAGSTRLVQLYPTPVVTGVSPGSGPKGGGSSVTITGKYFTEAYAVTFGGTSSSFRVVNDSTIVASAPSGPASTTVDIQVATPGGSSLIVGADHYQYGP